MSGMGALPSASAMRETRVPFYRIEAAICVLALAAVVLVWIAAHAVTRAERDSAIAAVIKSNANIARMVEEHTVRALDESDQALRMIQREYAQRGKALDLPGYYESLRLDTALHVHGVIANSAGDVVKSSVPISAPVNIADREQFQAHIAADNGTLVISKPIMSRVTGRWTLALTRRINQSDGSFGGIAAINIDPYYFTGLYQQIDLGEKGVIALAGLDGVIRARLDTGRANLGQDVSKSEVFHRVRIASSGSYIAASAVDGSRRIFSYRVVRGYPLLVNVGVAESVALAGVMERQTSYRIAATLISALLALGAGLLAVATGRRRRHAAALADGERRLQATRAGFLAKQTALTAIASDEMLSLGEVQPLIERITYTAATVMGIARVSLWRFSGDRSLLHCSDLYELAANAHSAGTELKVSDFPAYFAALEQKEVIDAADAHTDPRTSEFSKAYLTPLGISSMLDIPVFVGGKLDGVICCEHVGTPRTWSPEQRLFGTALAHLVEIADGNALRRSMMDALRKSEDIYRRMFESNPLPMWVRDSGNLKFLAVNDAALAAYGYTREEFLRLRTLRIEPEADIPHLQQAAAAKHAEDTVTSVSRHRRKDGTVIDVQVTVHPFFYDGRQARLIFAFDITERQRAEAALRESEQRLRALLDGIPDRVRLKDVQGRYVAINRGTERALGLPVESIIGKTDAQLLPPPEGVQIVEEERQIMASRQPLRVERVSRLQGTWTEVIKAPIVGADGEVAGLVGISRDITERRALEEDLHARDLEQRRALVREIHHRIKNHLQGVAGLLQGQARRHPALARDFQSAIGQLQAVALTHGLQGAGGQGIRFDRMVEAICLSMRGYADGAQTIHLKGELCSLLVDEHEAIPVALIVNELLMNAVKHGVVAGERQEVNVALTAAGAGVCLSITNHGVLAGMAGMAGLPGPPSTGRAAARARGDGLGIVRSLLPARGAVFALAQRGDKVCATLELQSPIVKSGDAAATRTPPATVDACGAGRLIQGSQAEKT